jgi:NADPH-dependent curcumin reductase CurA
MLVGQIAKIKGCRVVGIAGGAEKCQWIVSLESRWMAERSGELVLNLPRVATM